MSDKTFTITPDEQIVVEVPKNKRGNISNARTRAGIIQPKRTINYFPRRKKTAGKVRFFDLGQILSGGAWHTRTYSKDAAPDPFGSFVIADQLFESDFLERDELYLTSDGTLIDTGREIKTDISDFYKLTFYSDSYDSSAVTSNPDFDDTGLKIPDELLNDGNINFSGGSDIADDYPYSDAQRYFAQMTLTGDGKNHITNVYDINAAAVPYTLGKSDIFYLCPEIVSVEVENNYAGVRSIMGYAFTTFPRIFDKVLSFFRGVGISSGSDADYTQAVNNAAEILHVKASDSNPDEFGHYHPITIEDFKSLPVYPVDGFSVYYKPYFFRPQLAAIIKKGSQFFYVWRT